MATALSLSHGDREKEMRQKCDIVARINRKIDVQLVIV